MSFCFYTQAQNNYSTEIQKHREDLNKLFKSSKDSPLSSKAKKHFTGLPFFSANKKYKVKAKLKYTFNSPIQYIKNTVKVFNSLSIKAYL